MKILRITIIIIALSSSGVNAQELFDSIPEGSQTVMFKLTGNQGKFEFYPIYMKGSQPFITEDGVVYAPLEMLTYLLVEPSVYLDIERRQLQIRGIGENLYIGFSSDYPTKLIFDNIGYFQNEPLWLENGLYLPAKEFLSNYNMDVLWDSVLNIFTVINVPVFDTFEFLNVYSQPWGSRTGPALVDSVTSQAVIPREMGINMHGVGFRFFVKALSPLNRAVGAGMYRADGARILLPNSHSNCFPEVCIIENVEILDASKFEHLILIQLVVEKK